MKFTAILLFAFCLTASADGYAQKVTLTMKNVRLAKVFKEITKQTGFVIFYDNSVIDDTKRVTVNVRNETIEETLKETLGGQPLDFSISKRTITIFEKLDSYKNTVALATDFTKRKQFATITGTVKDANGKSLTGVSVLIKGTQRGTATNPNGSFSIEANVGETLVFTMVGYYDVEFLIKDIQSISIVLSIENTVESEIVVIGYGTQKKRDLTGSIAVVNGDDIAKQPSTNPVSSLQGLVAGLTIINSGLAGSSPTVRIRGVNSTNNSDPLYVVDGIMQTNIDYLNSADIQSIEVLKDPSSVSIYGLQGGNGVIIISTKRAKKGQTRISLQTSVNFQKVNHKIKVTDAAGFKKLYSTQLENIGAPPFDFSNFTANTDWQDQILRSAFQSNNSLSVSNSNDKSSTYLNVGYSNQDGVMKYNSYQKYIVRLNEEVNINKSIKVGGDVTGLNFLNNPVAVHPDFIDKIIWAAPIVPVKTMDGLYYTMPSFQDPSVQNPRAVIDENRNNTIKKGYRVTGNLFVEIKLLKNLIWKSSVYTDLSFNQSRGYRPLPFHYIKLGEGNIPTDTTYRKEIHTSVSQSQTIFKKFQQDHTLTFNWDRGYHHVTAMVGFSTLYNYRESNFGNRTDTTLNIPNDPSMWYLDIAQQSNPGNFGGNADEDFSTSYMGRVNYSFQGKYLANATFRRDGTSKFGPGHQWGNFGSLGLGWIVTEEKFLNNVKWLDFLKLKASWGTVGNGLNIGNYLSYPALANSNVGVFGENIYPSVTPTYIPDPNLHWERVEGKDVGFEAYLLRRRLNVELDFYDRKTHDILTFITLPGTSGNTNYFTNLGTIDNKGVEVNIGWSDKLGKAFNYSINANFSTNNNKVLAIGDKINFQLLGNDGTNVTESGHSIGYFFGYKQIGIYQTPDQIDKQPHMPSSAPGDIAYKDMNGDGKIDSKDRTYLGTPFPKYNFGSTISVNYKDFDFSIALQGVAGNKIFVKRRNYTFAILNYEANRLNAWTGAGTSNKEPILDNTHSDNYLFSSYWLESGDYFRIRTLQLGYTLAPRFLKSKGVHSLRLYISGQNLITKTKATGYSPEVPIHNPISAGVDNAVYPVPAIYTFGFNLTL